MINCKNRKIKEKILKIMTFFYASRRNTHLAPFFAIRRYLAPPEYQKTGFFPKNLFLNLSWMKIENKIKLEIEKKFLEQNGTFGEMCGSLIFKSYCCMKFSNLIQKSTLHHLSFPIFPHFLIFFSVLPQQGTIVRSSVIFCF